MTIAVINRAWIRIIVFVLIYHIVIMFGTVNAVQRTWTSFSFGIRSITITVLKRNVTMTVIPFNSFLNRTVITRRFLELLFIMAVIICLNTLFIAITNATASGGRPIVISRIAILIRADTAITSWHIVIIINIVHIISLYTFACTWHRHSPWQWRLPHRPCAYPYRRL